MAPDSLPAQPRPPGWTTILWWALLVSTGLSRLYGNDYRLELIPSPAGGALALLEVPWHSERETNP